ncbi:MAG: molecular chaperone TorD family protein [Pirellulales bacterium]|nr:molecular chaperone TorD family protein [Pirellulales bacterium]
MTDQLASDPKAVELLRRSAEWRLLGLLFECPGEGWREQLESLVREIADDELQAAVAAARDEATPELYHTTFGPGGPAAVREVSYRETILPGRLIVDLQAFYSAFAYQPVLDEPPDHAAVMLGFMSYLALKEAYALARGDAEQAAIAAEAAADFKNNHLAGMAEMLARLLVASEIRYLALAGSTLCRRAPSVGKATLDIIQPC